MPPGSFRTLIVIPCLNEEDHIESLALQLLGELDVCAGQIVIVDGGSTDRTLEIANRICARDSRIQVISNPSRLQSSSINLAVEKFSAECEYLIRIDAHGDYPRDYCATLVREIAATGASSVVVSMRSQGTTCFQRAAAAAQNSVLGNGGSAHRNDAKGRWIEHGHHAIMRISCFRDIGGYDPAFSHNEDAEFDVRMSKAGYRIWLTGATSMTYFPRRNPSDLFRQYYRYGRGRAMNVLKHRARPKLRQMVPLSTAVAVVLLAASPISLIFALPAAAWISLSLLVGLAIGLRSGDACSCLAGVAAMVMHLAWSVGFLRTLAFNR